MQASISGGSHPYGERSLNHQAQTKPQGPTDTPIGCSSGPRSFHTEGEGVRCPNPSRKNCCVYLRRLWPAAGIWDGGRQGRVLSWMWTRGAPRVPSHGIHALKLAEWIIARACPLLPGCPVPHPLSHPFHPAPGLHMGCGGPGLCSWCPFFPPEQGAELDCAGSHNQSESPVACWGWGDPPE